MNMDGTGRSRTKRRSQAAGDERDKMRADMPAVPHHEKRRKSRQHCLCVILLVLHQQCAIKGRRRGVPKPLAGRGVVRLKLHKDERRRTRCINALNSFFFLSLEKSRSRLMLFPPPPTHQAGCLLLQQRPHSLSTFQ